MVSQLSHTKYLGIGVVPTEVAQLADEFSSGFWVAEVSVNDVVESDVRQMTVANSTSSVLTGCFIDKDIFNCFHFFLDLIIINKVIQLSEVDMMRTKTIKTPLMTAVAFGPPSCPSGLVPKSKLLHSPEA